MQSWGSHNVLPSSATRCGGTYSEGTCSGRDCEMSQFWQNLQFTLQPAVATEKAIGPRQIVKERLLFDGINVRSANARVDQRVVNAAVILAHAAIAALLVSHNTFARAQLALDFAACQLLVKLRFDGESRIVLLSCASVAGCANSLSPSAEPDARAHFINERRSIGRPAGQFVTFSKSGLQNILNLFATSVACSFAG
jgi:hypothetical protein